MASPERIHLRRFDRMYGYNSKNVQVYLLIDIHMDSLSSSESLWRPKIACHEQRKSVRLVTVTSDNNNYGRDSSK